MTDMVLARAYAALCAAEHCLRTDQEKEITLRAVRDSLKELEVAYINDPANDEENQ